MQRQLFHRGGKSGAAQNVYRKSLFSGGNFRRVVVLAILLFAGFTGCSSHDPAKATSDPLAKVRLDRIIKFYTTYTAEKKKPPANEQVLKDFIRTRPQDEKTAAGIVGDDVDSLFVSPRDGQKYHIEYGTLARPTGKNRAFAWEETGQDGKRYVALTMGYVQEYGEEAFEHYKPKSKK
jgi:hypothetical protein